MNGRKKNEGRIPVILNLDGRISNSMQESVNLFADHFGSVSGDNTNNADEEYVDLYNTSISSVKVSMHVVHEKLCNLKPNKSCGPDELPPQF